MFVYYIFITSLLWWAVCPQEDYLQILNVWRYEKTAFVISGKFEYP